MNFVKELSSWNATPTRLNNTPEGTPLNFNGLPESIRDDQLEDTVIKVLDKIGVVVNSDNIQACHRLHIKNRTIVKFVNRKHAYESRRQQNQIERFG